MKRNRSDSKPGQSLGPDELRKVYVSLCGLIQIEPGPNFGVRLQLRRQELVYSPTHRNAICQSVFAHNPFGDAKSGLAN